MSSEQDSEQRVQNFCTFLTLVKLNFFSSSAHLLHICAHKSKFDARISDWLLLAFIAKEHISVHFGHTNALFVLNRTLSFCCGFIKVVNSYGTVQMSSLLRKIL